MTDIFRFADEVPGLEIKNGEILVSHDLAEKAFVQDWFNETHMHGLNLSKMDLIDLL